ncbi:esterase-like activity of phytase-domain-containing protein [Dipodascopsis tothii]|uniref:esterase-like activity of phytase-domain-containing protein n=1 Tax=Dipodascopsis tothii TaxID=44089 RepID=UPI0034CDDEE9
MPFLKSVVAGLAASASVCGVNAIPFSGFKAVVHAASTSSSAVTTATIGGSTFTYNGMAGYGFVPGNSTDKYGDTISFGSSITIERPSLVVYEVDGVTYYNATVYNLPDRGWNTEGTLNYIPRIHQYQIQFNPLASSSEANLIWTYVDTILLTDPEGSPMTGLDANTVLNFDGFHSLPAASYTGNGYNEAGVGGKRVSLDPESINLINGTMANGFWITDEYGPLIYRFNPLGRLVEAIRPSNAVIPYRNGVQSFSADSPMIGSGEDDDVDPADPDSGRANNQGFEGSSISPDGSHLWVLLQSAAVQDGGDEKYTNRYTRLFKYGIGVEDSPTFLAEYVVPLPQYQDPAYKDKKNPRTAAQSEIVALSDEIFLVLARDSNHGRAQDNTTSIYRELALYSIANATNVKTISGYDAATATVAPGGVLDDNITPATYYSFIDFNDETELAKFGLHNGGEDDYYLLNEKWEGAVLIPADGATGADGVFYIIAVSDDDFITQTGHMNFGRFDYADGTGANLDNQALVFKVTLPPSVQPFGTFPAGN